MKTTKTLVVQDGWTLKVRIMLDSNGYTDRRDFTNHKQKLLDSLHDALRRHYNASQIEIR